MPQVQGNGIEIEYDTFGDPGGRPLLLIIGLSSQMIEWPDAFCEKLAAKGHYVIRFDNRDIGLTSKIEDADVPDFMDAMAAHQAGKEVKAPYTLSDMAADAIGLMDALNIEKANVCGQSMGGMIAQVMAIEHPRRLLSLMPLSSSTGEPDLPPPSAQAMEAMMSRPPEERDEYIQYRVDVARAFSGDSDKFDAQLAAELTNLCYDRSLYPMGFVRQLLAVWASGSRKDLLADVSVPTLVIHGDPDPLVPLEHGRAIAEAIPGARLKVIKGLGHGTAYPDLWDEIVDAITVHTTDR